MCLLPKKKKKNVITGTFILSLTHLSKESAGEDESHVRVAIFLEGNPRT